MDSSTILCREEMIRLIGVIPTDMTNKEEMTVPMEDIDKGLGRDLIESIIGKIGVKNRNNMRRHNGKMMIMVNELIIKLN